MGFNGCSYGGNIGWCGVAKVVERWWWCCGGLTAFYREQGYEGGERKGYGLVLEPSINEII